MPSRNFRLYLANHREAYLKLKKEVKSCEDPKIYDKPPKKVSEIDFTKYTERSKMIMDKAGQ